MFHAEIRFYAELNDYLQPERQGKTSVAPFDDGATIGSLIERLGVPTSVVDLILLNGESVGLHHPVADGGRISVYPVFESFDITPATNVRIQPLRQTQFVLDTHLGRLASYLRMLGFDTLYRNDYEDEELIAISMNESRILLTRDRILTRRDILMKAYCVQESDPRLQVVEVLRRFDLPGSIRPFCRCLRCNTLLQPVTKEKVLDRLLPKTKEHFEEFQICPSCQRVFWKGSHHARMGRFVKSVVQLCEPAASMSGPRTSRNM